MLPLRTTSGARSGHSPAYPTGRGRSDGLPGPESSNQTNESGLLRTESWRTRAARFPWQDCSDSPHSKWLCPSGTLSSR